MIYRAPGKLFLIGEYAVLEGHAALVAGVDRYATIEAQPDTAPRFVDGAASWSVAADSLSELPEELGLIRAVAQTLHEAGSELASVRVSADSSELSADAKLGLGSSGAVCVGVLRALAPALAEDVVLDLALSAHRRFQGGRGSGGDVIASARGGLSVVLPNEFVTSLRVPPDLGFAVVYTGIAANTRERVDQFRLWRQNPESDEILSALAMEAATGIQAIVAGNSAGFCDQIRRFAAVERRMTEQGVDIFSDAVTRCVDALEEAGWAAKPSGAGGGDVVVAFHPSASPEELDAPCRAAGFERIPLALAPSGVLLTHP